jgi:hypothetical protein
VGYLNATVDTKHLRGKTERSIAVKTNDPEKAQFSLTLRAEVVTSIVVLPNESIPIEKGSPTVRRLIQKDPTESGTLEISEVKASVPWLSVKAERVRSVLPVGEDGLPEARPGDWLLSVDMTDAAPLGRSMQSIQFKTGLARQPVAELRVTAYVQPALQLSKQRVVLPAPGASAGDDTLMLSLRRGLENAPVQVDAQPPEIKVELVPAAPRYYRVLVSWEGSQPEEGSITFHVGDQQVVLPVQRAAATP